MLTEKWDYKLINIFMSIKHKLKFINVILMLFWSLLYVSCVKTLRWLARSTNHGFATITAHKMKFSIKDFFSKCDQIRSVLWIWSHLLKSSYWKSSVYMVTTLVIQCKKYENRLTLLVGETQSNLFGIVW